MIKYRCHSCKLDLEAHECHGGCCPQCSLPLEPLSITIAACVDDQNFVGLLNKIPRATPDALTCAQRLYSSFQKKKLNDSIMPILAIFIAMEFHEVFTSLRYVMEIAKYKQTNEVDPEMIISIWLNQLKSVISVDHYNILYNMVIHGLPTKSIKLRLLAMSCENIKDLKQLLKVQKHIRSMTNEDILEKCGWQNGDNGINRSKLENYLTTLCSDI